MDFNTLIRLLESDLKELEINQYSSGKDGSLAIAEEYLSSLPGCSSHREEKSILKMFYKDEMFASMRGQSPFTNSKSAIRTANNKVKTEKFLKENNVNTTESELFELEDYEAALSFVNDAKVELVLKPFNLNGGRGITLNVTGDNFDFAWTQAVKACEEKEKPFKVMIQPLVKGIEARMLVIEDKFNSAILRVPCHVIGNGEDNIQTLVDEKNRLRKKNPYLKMIPIRITDIAEHNLKEQGKTLETVPELDEIVFLQKSSNITQGGDNYEVSHLISDRMKKVAEEALTAIPDFHTGGVDLMIESFDDEAPVVLELNPAANLRMHHYPWKGEPKTPIHDLIDTLLKKYKDTNKIR